MLTNDKIIDGKKISEEIKNQIKLEISDLSKNLGLRPKLTVILVGEDEASKIYVKNKHITSLELGIDSEIIKLPEETKEKELINIIERLNNDKTTNGILVQLPLPKTIDTKKIINLINPSKDVDCFHIKNIGLLVSGNNLFLPCTPSGIIEVLKYKNIDLTSKNVVIVGRSNIVGKPLALMMIKENATVTLCHSKTINLSSFTKNADIVVMAIGSPLFLKKEMIKENSILVDVGINRVNGNVVGDIDFFDVLEKCKFITPVPGGIGKMTIAMLMKNTLLAYKIQNNLV